MIGMAHVWNGVPLYYDACNEFGLCAAGLNFPHLAAYHPPVAGKRNIASFELIPFILGQCKTVKEAIHLLQCVNVTHDAVAEHLPPTPLHWLIGDQRGAVCIEPMAEGILLHDAPVGVMTNAPAYPEQMSRLSDFMLLSPAAPVNRLCPQVQLSPHSRGAGALGLPGDFSSASRFVRAVFCQSHTVHEDSADKEILRFFHVLDSVSIPLGCSQSETGRPVCTIYAGCIDTALLTYYYTTYDCRTPRHVTMTEENMEGAELSRVNVATSFITT
jgi:choloylglycine hydrolase